MLAACAEPRRSADGAGGGGANAPPFDASAGETVRYLALGDSFTIGTGSAAAQAFPSRLVERWRARGCVVTLQNVAVNGFTTDDLIREELPALSTFRPTFVTVAVGANDIVHGSSVESYRGNVDRILDAALQAGAQVVVLPQPDWSRSPIASSFGTRESLEASIVRFNAALAEEARVKRATWVDLQPLMKEQATRAQVASDGLHPSADAYDAWATAIARVLPSPCKPQ